MLNNKPDFQALYKELQPQILHYVKARIGSREDAEDITAEVFVRVYKNLDDFQWQGVSINSWVYRIAKNAIIDHYRKYNKNKNQVEFEKASQHVAASEKDILLDILDDEEEKSLYVAISQLDTEDQYLIYYKYFEDLSISEIAKRLNLSETNVGTKLHRLRKKILSRLATTNKDDQKIKK